MTEMRRLLKPSGQLLGYDLTATQAARVIHGADRSPHRFLTLTDLTKGLINAGFGEVQVSASWADHVLRFSARRV